MATHARHPAAEERSTQQLELFEDAVASERADGKVIPLDKARGQDTRRERLTLGEAARIIREAVKDKSYRATPLGQLVGR
jgi:hypothetical protein